MAKQTASKLNRLASAAPAGAVLLAHHLERLGFSRDLQTHYVRAGWLDRLGRGAFVRPHEPPTWQGAVYALRRQAELPLHVGATSALGLHGRAHYLPQNEGGALDLFTPSRTTLPRWFAVHPWPLVPRHTRTDVLPPDLGVEEREVGAGAFRLPLAVASAERAMLECLYLMPTAVDPVAARELMEGLVDLRPKVMTTLLQACGSVRVKRLFLMLADGAGHRWLGRVDLTGVDLGRGKRSVAGGGVYLPEHRLAVPAALAGGAGGGRMTETYRAQVDLLLRVLPHVADEPCFALKGGTALNLFLRDMPRLSVDLDLTYLPVAPRDESLREVEAALDRIAARVGAMIGPSQATRRGAKVVVQTPAATVKVEANTVLRGALFAPRELSLCDAAQTAFGRFVAAPIVSDAELFGGKLVAALDRQHPRDLFDARYILDAAVTADAAPDGRLRLGFLTMLLSHDRPPHEVIAPHAQDRAAAFASQFAGMSSEPFDAADGCRAFDDLLARLPNLLPSGHRRLLLSFVAGEPDWSQAALPPTLHAPADLPAVRWKLQNLRRLRGRDPRKHADQLARLRDTLDAMPAV